MSLVSMFTPYIIETARIESWGANVVAGKLLVPYLLITFILTIIFLGTLIISYRRSKGLQKNQLMYFITGFLLFTGINMVTNVLFPIFLKTDEYAKIGSYASIFFVGFTAYAIVAHRLFDIRIIIKRTIIYSALLLFVLATYSLVVFSFAAVFGSETQITMNNFISNLIAATLIAIGFDPLKRWLTNITDNYLFKVEYKPQEVTNQLSSTLSSVIDLDEAVLSMMEIITREMRLKNAATFILTSYEDTTEVKRVKQVGYKNPDVLKLTRNGPVIQYFASLPKDSVVVTEELVRDLSDKKPYTQNSKHDLARIAVKLQKLRASIVLPITVKEKLIGIFIVGDKLSDDLFSNQDLQFLKTVANQTAAAIEKARFYEEDQLKTEFVSIASHELLTPTAAIEGYLSMILDDKLIKVDEKTRVFLDKIYKSSRRLADLVKDLLQVSRIEAGRIVVDQKPFDLIQNIANAVDALKITAEEKKMDLKFIKPEKEIKQVFADPEKITQVITNLISNAIKYSKKEGAKAEVRIQAVNNHAIRVSVADNGIGMSEDTIKHLFEKFYRSPDVMSYYQGTGLGLYISKNLIEKMNGKMEVESVMDKGSTFSFTVPVYTGHEKRQVLGDPKLMTPDQRQAAGIEDEDGTPSNGKVDESENKSEDAKKQKKE